MTLEEFLGIFLDPTQVSLPIIGGESSALHRRVGLDLPVGSRIRLGPPEIDRDRAVPGVAAGYELLRKDSLQAGACRQHAPGLAISPRHRILEQDPVSAGRLVVDAVDEPEMLDRADELL